MSPIKQKCCLFPRLNLIAAFHAWLLPEEVRWCHFKTVLCCWHCCRCYQGWHEGQLQQKIRHLLGLIDGQNISCFRNTATLNHETPKMSDLEWNNPQSACLFWVKETLSNVSYNPGVDSVCVICRLFHLLSRSIRKKQRENYACFETLSVFYWLVCLLVEGNRFLLSGFHASHVTSSLGESCESTWNLSEWKQDNL